MSSFFERKLPQEEEMAAAEERVTELIKLEGAGQMMRKPDIRPCCCRGIRWSAAGLAREDFRD